MSKKLTPPEILFLRDFVKHCNDIGLDYHGYNAEQMEAHMLDFINNRHGNEKIKVFYDANGDMHVNIH